MNLDTTTTNPPPTDASPTSSRRWTAALIVIGVVVATSIFVLVVLAGLGGSSSIVDRWVPAETTAYAELRLDLPGDQDSQLAAFLAAFPGFDDTTRLPDKLAELGDRILGGATGGRLDYSTQIAPWFGGQIGLAGTRIDLAEGSGGNRPSNGLLVATVTDADAAAAWARSLATPSGTETYEGVAIATVGSGPAQASWAITGGVLLAGDSASVRAAIDTDGSSSFPSRSDVSTARREVGRDQIAFWFVDATPIRQALEQGLEGAPVPLPSDAPIDALPAWLGGGLRFESSEAVATTVMPHMADGAATNATSQIPGRIPETTILLVDGHDIGPRIATLLDSAGASQDLGSIEGALRLLGGADGLVGWIAELGVVVDAPVGSPTGGLVAISSDPQASQSLFTQLEVAARLAGGEVTKQDAGGIPIVTVTLTGLDRLLGVNGLQAFGRPVLPPTGPVSLSWAVSGDLVVVGPDPAFVRSVTGTTSDTSLASNEIFQKLLGQAGSQHVALGWADPRQALRLAIASAPELPGGLADPGSDAARYLAPLDGVLGTFVVGGSVDRSTVILSVTEQD